VMKRENRHGQRARSAFKLRASRAPPPEVS
jgi:hypothetical protein